MELLPIIFKPIVYLHQIRDQWPNDGTLEYKSAGVRFESIQVQNLKQSLKVA